jgi:hypothetical protein
MAAGSTVRQRRPATPRDRNERGTEGIQMTKWLTFVAACSLIVTSLISGPGAVSAQTLRIGLAEDPDMLDPTLSRTFVSYVVRSALCRRNCAGGIGVRPQFCRPCILRGQTPILRTPILRNAVGSRC